MKNNTTALLLLLLAFNGVAQDMKFEYRGRLSPSANKEQLKQATLVSDVTDDLWHYLAFSYYEREELEKQVRIKYPDGNNIYPMPDNFTYPDETYNQVVEYVSVAISVTANGKVQTAASAGSQLTAEQKHILNMADLGTDIGITIRFKQKSKPTDKPGSECKMIEGTLKVAVVPEMEAEYPGGNKEITKYLTENVFNKVTGKSASEKIEKAVVKFTVNEEGRIVDAKMLKSSTDAGLDKLILDATNKMPVWKPAQNAMGVKVKQEFSIPFMTGGC